MNVNVGDKVRLIPFEEALQKQSQDPEPAAAAAAAAEVFGISECTWSELVLITGTIKQVYLYEDEGRSVYKVGFERTLDEDEPETYIDDWFIPDFALQPQPQPEIRVHIKQMGPGYINLELTVYDPETQQERPATFKETKSYVEQHPGILGFGGWIMGANGVHQCID